MLRQLTITDFVLVERLELEFAAGFGTLTGETGAGKSILVDALAFVLGERADTALIRAGCERAEVSAEFDVGALAEVRQALMLQEIADDDGSLLLRRVVDAGGRSRAWLNGTPVTLQQLRAISDQLVDIHGQHAHQSLLRGDAQRETLDGYAGLHDEVAAVQAAFRVWRDARTTWQASLSDGEALRRERESLQWEVDELRALAFDGSEWQALNEEQGRLAHAAALIEGAGQCLLGLSEADGACLAQLSEALARIDGLCIHDARLADIAALLRSAEVEVGEAVAQLRRYGERVELDPSRLSEVDRRIDAILGTARKFRLPPAELGEALRSREQRLAALAQAADPDELQRRCAAAEKAYRALAGKLSAARAIAARKLSAAVSERMQSLALGGGVFEVALVALDEGASSGLERVEFRVGGLAGAQLQPLARVASGGELSRISLALHVAASQAARVPTLIFDEVDVGIGGAVAETVGRLLHQLGRQRQVLCVTHLPQVAACADWQWRVAKLRKGAQARSEVEVLDGAGREEEIARMLGGVEITALTRQHAREMLARR